MSQSDNAEREQTAAVAVPEACQGCRGQLPRATPVEVEDMVTQPLEKLIRKAQVAQKMLNDVMEQIQKQQQHQESHPTKAKSKHHKSGGGKSRRHKVSRHGRHFSSSSSSSGSGNSDCELIAVERQKEMTSRSRRHIRDDRKRDRSRSRGRSRGHSRGRSHGRSRSRSYTDSRRSGALPLALPVRISV